MNIPELKAKLVATGHFSFPEPEEIDFRSFPIPRGASRPRFYGQDDTTHETLANIERENINATSRQ